MKPGPALDARVYLERVQFVVTHENAGESLDDGHHERVGDERNKGAKEGGCDQGIVVRMRVAARVVLLFKRIESYK
jgi:hypothetical protein